ncbi:hypothetical protein F5Y13DRAFT_157362 [Hypoxylon sp. FL1857]|nr:hypothetical protein F5Y13DRAFT_157362 [Hypoxylon sp. FL1857]
MSWLAFYHIIALCFTLVAKGMSRSAIQCFAAARVPSTLPSSLAKPANDSYIVKM